MIKSMRLFISNNYGVWSMEYCVCVLRGGKVRWEGGGGKIDGGGV